MAWEIPVGENGQIEIHQVLNGWIVVFTRPLQREAEQRFGPNFGPYTAVAETPERLCEIIDVWTKRHLKPWDAGSKEISSPYTSTG